MKPIYRPSGAAAEYAELALNIYTGCTHGCSYCFAPGILRKTREEFARDVHAREGLISALERQLASGAFSGETIHLCFTCDPYPSSVDTTPTREVIRMLKDAGCHVQILTKNAIEASLSFDLLDSDDRFGITLTGAEADVEPLASFEYERIEILKEARRRGIGTWVSFEPVINPNIVANYIGELHFVDIMMIGKLNHRKSDVDWRRFGEQAELLCKLCENNYVIKESLRDEMERSE